MGYRLTLYLLMIQSISQTMAIVSTRPERLDSSCIELIFLATPLTTITMHNPKLVQQHHDHRDTEGTTNQLTTLIFTTLTLVCWMNALTDVSISSNPINFSATLRVRKEPSCKVTMPSLL